jgi:hypothetical protein
MKGNQPCSFQLGWLPEAELEINLSEKATLLTRFQSNRA